MAYDPRFDQAEANLRRGQAWLYREPDAPNPLTIEVSEWSEGHTVHGPAEFLNGVDKNGNQWSVLVGAAVLRKRLIDGELSDWDDERKAYVVTNLEGRVQEGDIVSILYLGERETAAGGKKYADFKVERIPPLPAPLPTEVEDELAFTPAGVPDDDIPF
jgi:hypothetical protein